jgi:hypothetical protein
MYDASPSSHPLDISSTECALMSSEVLMREASLQCVRYSFEASVWVIWESRWQFYLSQIEHEERIKRIQSVNAYESTDFGSHSFALLFSSESLSNLFEMLSF